MGVPSEDPVSRQRSKAQKEGAARTVVTAHFEQNVILIADIGIHCPRRNTRPQYYRLVANSTRRHLANQLQVVLAWYIRDTDWPTTNTPRCSMERGVLSYSLEHVPVRKHVQMPRENAVKRVDPDMPRMRG